jgi:CRP/FNR family cyclic AMP-dependent transcriptional regulator
MDRALSKIGIFAGLEAEVLVTIAQRIVWQRAEADRLLISQADPSSDIYFLAEGSVRAKFFSEDGKEVSFADLAAGELFGELAAVDECPRASSVVSLTPVLYGRMTARQFREVAMQHASIAWKLAETLVGKVRRLSDRIAEFSILAARQRLQQEIIRISTRGSVRGSRIVVEGFPTHQELANRISSHREAVTRELSFLAAENIISIRRGEIEIIDIDRLRQISRHFDTPLDR